ncbi:MAG: hypothetical protein K2P31_03510 [Rickettsiaceae bacterium]|nr:hypothetical protein [Rickettsiaceae bacterium]
MIVYLNRATIIKSSKTFLNVLDGLMEQESGHDGLDVSKYRVAEIGTFVLF